MEFNKYSSIENSYRDAFLAKCHDRVGDAMMVALEKIHGANFSWLVTADGIRVAKRSGLVDELESFYGHSRFYARYAPTVKRLWDYIVGIDRTVTQIQLFGEIFGGHYHGNAVVGAKNVQSGMHYHPDTEFAAFDLKLTHQDGTSEYLAFSVMEDAIDDVNFMTMDVETRIKIAPVLKVGTLKELVAIDPLFHSLVPEHFGVSDGAVPTDRDYGEGFVIRGFHRDYYVGNERVILKQKNALFKEKEKTPNLKVVAELEPEVQEFLENVCSYINENRVRAVASKDTYDPKAFGKLQGDVVRDALEDFEKDEGFKATESEHWSQIAKKVGGHAAQVIRPVWVNLFD